MMDKIKALLAKIQRHHFWVLAAVGVAIMLYCWNESVHEIERGFKKNKTAVSSQFKKMKTDSQRSVFPNESWIKETTNVANKVSDNVAAAWTDVIEMQQKGTAWPNHIVGDDGNETFDPDQGEIDLRGFADEVAKEESDEEKAVLVLHYAEAAPLLIRELRKILDVDEGTGQGGVDWDQSNYDLLKKAYATDEIKNLKWSDCRDRQKFLWVFQAMGQAIANTNKDEDDKYNLPIHTIKELAVAGGAARLNEAKWSVEVSENTTQIDASGEGAKGKTSAKRGSALQRRGKTNAPKTRKSRGNKSLQKPLVDEIKDPPRVDGYELIPFRMRVRMDPHYLNALLGAIANLPLPLEIQGLRFHRTSSLKPIKSAVVKKPQTSNSTRRRFRNRQTNQPTKEVAAEPKPDAEEVGRGILVEIWGYAYLADAKEPMGAEAVGQNSNGDKNVKPDTPKKS